MPLLVVAVAVTADLWAVAKTVGLKTVSAKSADTAHLKAEIVVVDEIQTDVTEIAGTVETIETAGSQGLQVKTELTSRLPGHRLAADVCDL